LFTTATWGRIALSRAGDPAPSKDPWRPDWRHDQRGGSAFHVYPIDLKILRLRVEWSRRNNEQRQNQELFHNRLFVFSAANFSST